MTRTNDAMRWVAVAVGVAVGALLLFSGTRDWAWWWSPKNGLTARELGVPTLPLGAAALAAATVLAVARGVWRRVAAVGAFCVGAAIAATCVAFVHDTETPVNDATTVPGEPQLLIGYPVGETAWPYVAGGGGVLFAVVSAAAGVAATRPERPGPA